jgi:1-acylglycerone phosphate reductase
MSHRTVVITGCSSGIGKALAKQYHSQGYQVIAGARRPEKMTDLKDLGIITVQLDVTSDESVRELKEKVKKWTGGRLDVLINNAGQGCGNPAIETSVDRSKEIFDVNLFGVMRMTNAFSPLLIRAKGKIVNVGSVAGIIMFPFGSTYAATKAALHAYSDILRLELKAFEVEVITVVTGGVATEIADGTPFIKDSLYAQAKYTLDRKANISKESSPMPAEVFAYRVYNHVSKKDTNPRYWQGSKTLLIRLVTTFLPRWVIELGILRRFKLNEFIAFIRKKRAANELTL